MLVVGPKEAESNTVNVRMRGSRESRTVPVEQFQAEAKQKIADKTVNLTF